MSTAKVIEIVSESDKSFEDAISNGIKTASKTIHNIRGAWVQEQQVKVDDNRIVAYRVNLKITFVMD